MSKTALVEHDPQLPQAQTDAGSFVAMLERASRDPAVDVAKLERLMAIHERMLARNAETAFNAALAAVQTELPEMPEHGTIKNKAGGVQSKYALWEDVNAIIKPVLSRHGFALTFRTGNEGSKIVVTGILSHAAGHSVSSVFALPVDLSGSKNEVQGLGSAISYGKRYVAGALLNLTSRGEDNDGQGGKLQKMSEQQLADWTAAIDALDSTEAASACWAKIAAACTELGDVSAYDALKSAMAKRMRELKGAK